MPGSLRILAARIRGLFSRRRDDQEFSNELQTHLALLTEENVRRGMSLDEARRQARIRLGGVTQLRETHRELIGLPFLDTLWQDLRFALRMLRKTPGFTAVAVLTLALGIGATTSIYSLADQILLKSLPIQHPDQLVILGSTEIKWGRTQSDYDMRNSFSYPMYKSLREHNTVFAGVLACFGIDASVSWHGHASMADGELVSGNFFNVLGVHPALGRVLTAADETAPGANPVAVLDFAYWQNHFGGDPSILNELLDVNGTSLTVVGVTQPGFFGVQVGSRPDIYVPITMKPQMTPEWNGLDNVNDYFLPVLARLKPGMTVRQAQAGIQPLFHALLESELPLQIKDIGLAPRFQKRYLQGKIELTPGIAGRPLLKRAAETPLLFLSGMVGLVLLIACTNLACLLFARGEVRHHETAVRLALGARRSRIVRQLLTESMLLAMGGGAAGLLLAAATLRGVVAAIPPHSGAVALDAHLDWSVLAFAAGLVILTALVSGILPALRASRAELQSAFKEQGASGSAGVSSVRLRKSLLVLQVAMTAVLLVTAGLFGESLVHLEDTNFGMRISHIVQFSMVPAMNRYSPPQTTALFQQLTDELSAVPGVTSAGVAENPVLTGAQMTDTITYEASASGKNESSNPWVNYVGPKFFSTLGIPLLEGREFKESDNRSSASVAIINKSLARRYFAGRNPVGLHLGFGVPNIQIVGVVADAKQIDPRSPPGDCVYFPYEQDSTITGGIFYVRTPLSAQAMVPAIREAVVQYAPDVPTQNFLTLEQQLNDTLFSDRAISFLTAIMGALGGILAAVGLYGVMAYIVARRTREIGIRVALGATPKQVARMIFVQAAGVAAVGVIIGLALAYPVARWIRSELFGVNSADPLTFAGVAALLCIVAVLASYVPARRAMRVDPMVALRYE